MGTRDDREIRALGHDGMQIASCCRATLTVALVIPELRHLMQSHTFLHRTVEILVQCNAALLSCFNPCRRYRTG